MYPNFRGFRANIIKIETRNRRRFKKPWSTYLDKNSKDQKESAYFLSVNRNKKSVTIDLTTEEGQELARNLVKNVILLLKILEWQSKTIWP